MADPSWRTSKHLRQRPRTRSAWTWAGADPQAARSVSRLKARVVELRRWNPAHRRCGGRVRRHGSRAPQPDRELGAPVRLTAGERDLRHEVPGEVHAVDHQDGEYTPNETELAM